MSKSPFADHLSSPQVSRASAAAIRISVTRGDIWDGFHLWRSLRWSMYYYQKPGSTSTLCPPFRVPSPFVPIDFGRPVSSRLATHCLLHSLLRAGKTKLAAQLTEDMMDDGQELHPLSFGTLLSLLSTESPQAAYDGRSPTRKVHPGPRILNLQNALPANPFTRIAVRLLNKARDHRWQRTTSMYESVFRACLMQGEILVASLLLALLLKDYQLRRACTRVAIEAERVGAQDTMAYVQSKIPEAPSLGFKFLPHQSSHFLYRKVTKFLGEQCAQVEGRSFSEASQALAILASELDARRIPYADLDVLIKVMYSYPQCQHSVWIKLPTGEWRLRNAYCYFNEVLLNFLRSLPDQGLLDLNKNKNNTSRLPSLNVESYNALLHFALRYRHSPILANRILHHMTEVRKPPLAPSTSTYNILLRSSTLMRRNDIAESILHIVPWQMPDDKDEVHRFSTSTRISRTESSPTGSQRFVELLESIRRYELNIPKPKENLKPDKILLTSYMAHLVATGRPDMVAVLITRAIPEINPPKNRVPPEELLARWQTGVVRGVTLGPHFFAVALNALCKARLWRLAERVWALALDAETKALESGVMKPWCLSVHAYTAMLRLYADQTKECLANHTSRDPTRAASTVQSGMQVFRALSLAVVKVHDATVRARKEGREWKHPPTPPKADARFYNAALSLVRHRPGMQAGSGRIREPEAAGSHQGSRTSWNYLPGKARQRFLLTGHRPRWTPELEEISESLEGSGYALPIGFGLPLVGREEQVTSQDRTDFAARPYSFGKKVRTRFAPHRLPTVKRKGLPLRHQWRRSIIQEAGNRVI